MKISKMLIPLVISTLLAGCGNNDVSTSDVNDDSVIETEKITENITEAVTEDVTEIFSKKATDGLTEYETWQEAYKALMLNHMTLEESIHASHFSLMDFDGDDIPELCLGLGPKGDITLRLYQIYQVEKGSDGKYRVSKFKTYFLTDHVNYPLYYIPGQRIFSYAFGAMSRGTYTMRVELFDENGEIYKQYRVGELCDVYKVDFDDPVLEQLGIHFETMYSEVEYGDEWVEVCGSDSYEINEENISRYIENLSI